MSPSSFQYSVYSHSKSPGHGLGGQFSGKSACYPTWTRGRIPSTLVKSQLWQSVCICNSIPGRQRQVDLELAGSPPSQRASSVRDHVTEYSEEEAHGGILNQSQASTHAVMNKHTCI